MTKLAYKVISKLDLGSINNVSTVSGGCINNACKVETNSGSYFLKSNSLTNRDLLKTEARALEFIKDKSTLTTPDLIYNGVLEENSFLLLSFLEKGATNHSFWRNFALGLAEFHRNTSDSFGLEYDNFIGALPQSNAKHKKWVDFYLEERIIPQLKLSVNKGFFNNATIQKVENDRQRLNEIFPDEKPSLIHGDLWSGNYLPLMHDQAAIVDPAIHFGHREMDIAFSMLFGGFSTEFYDHYQEIYPLEPDFDSRKDLYNLYYLLVHLNLFGTGYYSSCNSIIKHYFG